MTSKLGYEIYGIYQLDVLFFFFLIIHSQHTGGYVLGAWNINNPHPTLLVVATLLGEWNDVEKPQILLHSKSRSKV